MQENEDVWRRIPDRPPLVLSRLLSALPERNDRYYSVAPTWISIAALRH